VLCLKRPRFMENYPIWSWETNLCFLRGVLSQITKIGSVGNWLTPIDYVASNISDQVRYFFLIPKPWHWFQVGYIRPRTDISDASDISSLRSGSRALSLVLDRIYLTLGGHIWRIRYIWSLVGFQNRGSQVRSDISYLHQIYPILCPSDISDSVEISRIGFRI
jgi:hypothetical protein